MNSSLDINLFKPLGRLLRRYNLTIFIVFIVTCLVGAVLLLNNILNEASLADGYQSPLTTNSIDKATLERINTLHTSTDPYPEAPQPSGRINPFGE